MKFLLNISRQCYSSFSDEGKSQIEHVRSLGFILKNTGAFIKNGKFGTRYIIDDSLEHKIEISTLEELLEFQKRCKCELIIMEPSEDGARRIEIYNDHRE